MVDLRNPQSLLRNKKISMVSPELKEENWYGVTGFRILKYGVTGFCHRILPRDSEENGFRYSNAFDRLGFANRVMEPLEASLGFQSSQSTSPL